MPEQDYSAVAVDALAAVKGIQSGIDELVQFAREDHAPQPEPLAAETPDTVEVIEQPTLTEYEHQQLGYMWMLSVTGIVIAAVLMLNLGVNLWNAFSDKWRA